MQTTTTAYYPGTRRIGNTTTSRKNEQRDPVATQPGVAVVQPAPTQNTPLTKGMVRTLKDCALGRLRVSVDEDGSPLFCLTDLAAAAGLKSLHSENINLFDKTYIKVSCSPKKMIFVNYQGATDYLKAMRDQSRAGLLLEYINSKLEPRQPQEAPAPSAVKQDFVQGYTFSQIAKELGFDSGASFIHELCRKGVLTGKDKNTKEYLLAPAHCGKGYTTSRLYNGKPETAYTVWTEEGRSFLLNLFKGHSPAASNISDKFLTILKDCDKVLERTEALTYGSRCSEQDKAMEALCASLYESKSLILDIMKYAILTGVAHL